MFIEVLTTEEILRWEIWLGKFGALCYHGITANIFDCFLLHYQTISIKVYSLLKTDGYVMLSTEEICRGKGVINDAEI